MKTKVRLLFPCYFAFLVNGAMVLLVGAILPFLIEEAGVSYGVAGGFLSAFAIGNFAASFLNPVLAGKIGLKATTVITSALIPISFFLITLIPPVPVIYILFVAAGIGRGCCSIINNAVVNDNSDGKPMALNLLHMTFAIGAFAAPFLMSIYLDNGFNWRAIVYTIIIGSALATAAYAWMKLDYDKPGKIQSESSANQKNNFWKHPAFFITGLIMFFYLGLENCVNGWFVTYFKSTGIMTDSFATNLVSYTWLAVMLGRLLTAYLSARISKKVLIMIDCIVTALFFVLLISTQNLNVITIAIIGLGLFFAGIYPTCVSNAGIAIKGSTLGTSMLLAMAALGGIITPQIVGLVADRIGLVGAIGVLLINVVAMILLSVLNYVQRTKTELEELR